MKCLICSGVSAASSFPKTNVTSKGQAILRCRRREIKEKNNVQTAFVVWYGTTSLHFPGYEAESSFQTGLDYARTAQSHSGFPFRIQKTARIWSSKLSFRHGYSIFYSKQRSYVYNQWVKLADDSMRLPQLPQTLTGILFKNNIPASRQSVDTRGAFSTQIVT